MITRFQLKKVAKGPLGRRLAARRPVRTDLPLSEWDLSVGDNGRLRQGDLDLQELAESQSTPLHLVSEDAIDRKLNEIRDARMPLDARRPDLYYSYKTNPVPAVLTRLHDRGVGAEVISAYELWLALRLGVDPGRIIYNGPAKSPESVRIAVERGVSLINVNSSNEMRMTAEIAASVGVGASVGVRVSLDGMWGGQFGISDKAPELSETIRFAAADDHLDLMGLHFHRGFTMRSGAEVEDYLRGVLASCDRLRLETGFNPAVLDIGGSLATPTVASLPVLEGRLNRAFGTDLLPPDPAVVIGLAEASTLVARIVTEHYSAVGIEPPRIVMEPGRALTGDTQLLLTSVVDVKLDGNVPYAILDAGVNVAEPVTGEYHQVFSVSEPNTPPTTSYRLAGPICTPGDVLYNGWRLPELRPGHVLAIMDSGAYFVPFSTSFSFPRPPVLIHGARGVEVGRRRESFSDLTGYDELPELITDTDEPRP